jgi:hypothetical protein
MSVQAIKGGAIEFLTKPFRDQDLLDAIQLGLARDRAWLENEKVIAALRSRFETHTPRERKPNSYTGLLALGFFPREVQLIGHSGQVRQRSGFHLSHDLAAMHFYGDFADADVVGDLLVDATIHH